MPDSISRPSQHAATWAFQSISAFVAASALTTCISTSAIAGGTNNSSDSGDSSDSTPSLPRIWTWLPATGPTASHPA
ncbi:MAG: hypothetical protein QM516_13105, partial [Limnohabitans sp.]|nr:hypothetical protein [Limnohabitans sp.]